MERATGLKTPAKVPSVLPERSVSEIPNSTYPSDTEFELVELFPTNAPNRRKIRMEVIGDLSFSDCITFGLTAYVQMYTIRLKIEIRI